MITTVTLNPAIDREYFVPENKPKEHQYIYTDKDINVTPGGKGVLSSINLKHLGHSDVQNIGFVGGRQGLFFEKMIQEHKITTNYVYTKNEIRNNIFVIGKDPVTYTHYNDYTYRVEPREVEELIKRFKRGITDSDFIMISGSIPEGVNFSIYQRLIEICHDLDKEVYLHASGEALNRALEAKPKVVVPYFKHTNKILDKPVSDFEDYIWAGKKLLEGGAQYVMLPYHCDRLLFDDTGVYSLSPKNFCLRNWLGAGEAYNAAFFDYVNQHGFDFIEANKYAGAAALDIAERKSVFLENKEEIEEHLDQIEVEKLEV
ncbi:fructose-1-phosphate kinase/fructose-6-phosphate kinase [Halobacteroides halobius DSM 5150]|uniref:Tagatose-6-phosphate kinase n=1 Tax=Halobacteroides halobius (strain ATCC 35273 / DSM 5150 / MD-1) TaxID=748449 RepID=L0K855_HALHC|nr:PfkB family carbohydrate kinase [Halobacteroides halobius]AGB40730.1 fructose-1-phosphate kinase/fructose-6-phosphate kinase [Halobacteroides halobius DSM 5150]